MTDFGHAARVGSLTVFEYGSTCKILQHDELLASFGLMAPVGRTLINVAVNTGIYKSYSHVLKVPSTKYSCPYDVQTT